MSCSLYLQEPVTVELGTRYKYQFSGSKRRLVQKSDTFQYVPLIDNLQWILQNKDVYDEVKGQPFYQYLWDIIKFLENAGV